ncbi:MAG: hypothetical protein KGI04_00075 [Candidatus Micrarchaeota archaeon]|nr:hypothetical protein [Candidatus Micrarchaeota archaeon]
MVKTTVMLEDDLYKELVNESINEYGSTRKLSLLINRKLRASRGTGPKKLRITPLRLGRKITEGEIERLIEEGRWEAIKWRE